MKKATLVIAALVMMLLIPSLVLAQGDFSEQRFQVICNNYDYHMSRHGGTQADVDAFMSSLRSTLKSLTIDELGLLNGYARRVHTATPNGELKAICVTVVNETIKEYQSR